MKAIPFSEYITTREDDASSDDTEILDRELTIKSYNAKMFNTVQSFLQLVISKIDEANKTEDSLQIEGCQEDTIALMQKMTNREIVQHLNDAQIENIKNSLKQLKVTIKNDVFRAAFEKELNNVKSRLRYSKKQTSKRVKTSALCLRLAAASLPVSF